jgi:hypothetical protein
MKIITVPDDKPSLGRESGGNDVMKVVSLPGDKSSLPGRESGGNDVMKESLYLVINPRSQAENQAEMTS